MLVGIVYIHFKSLNFCANLLLRRPEDGNVTWKPNNIYAFYCVQVIRWFSVLALWGGVIAVIIRSASSVVFEDLFFPPRVREVL